MFASFLDVDIKVVLDRQPLLGTDLWPEWTRKLAHGRAMVELDDYNDELWPWRCVAVHRGARPDRSTQAARAFAKSFLKLGTTPNDCPRSALDEFSR